MRDVLEQFSLSRDTHQPFLRRYDLNFPSAELDGTIAIAQKLGIRHPTIYSKKDRECWTLTTDLVLVYGSGKQTKVIPVSAKREFPSKARQGELFELERKYWEIEGCRWILFVFDLVPLRVRLNILALVPWILISSRIPDDLLDRASKSLDQGLLLLHEALGLLQISLGVSLTYAQAIFWQAVWSGRIPIDLREDLFRGKPLARISFAAFKAFNPIWSGRSAWPG